MDHKKLKLVIKQIDSALSLSDNDNIQHKALFDAYFFLQELREFGEDDPDGPDDPKDDQDICLRCEDYRQECLGTEEEQEECFEFIGYPETKN